VSKLAKKKKLTKEQIRERARKYAKKMTLGKAHYIHAEAGAAIDKLQLLQSGQHKLFLQQMSLDYTGINTQTMKFQPEYLVRGHAGLFNEKVYRKFASWLGFKPYPTGKPKTMSSFVNWLSMYGIPALKAYENKDNLTQAHREVYKSLYGVDLTKIGWDAYQPAAMMETKGIYTIQKTIKNIIKGW